MDALSRQLVSFVFVSLIEDDRVSDCDSSNARQIKIRNDGTRSYLEL